MKKLTNKHLLSKGFVFDGDQYELNGLVIYSNYNGGFETTIGDYRNNILIKIETIDDLEFIIQRLVK